VLHSIPTKTPMKTFVDVGALILGIASVACESEGPTPLSTKVVRAFGRSDRDVGSATESPREQPPRFFFPSWWTCPVAQAATSAASDVDDHCRVEERILVSVALGVGHHPRAANAVVERVVDMAVHPQVGAARFDK